MRLPPLHSAILALVLFGCVPLAPSPSSSPVPSPSASVAPATLPPVNATALNSCQAYSWKDRSRAPAGYIQGMMRSFTRSACRLHSANAAAGVAAADILGKELGDPSKDALALFGHDARTDMDRLRLTYTLGIGLGMRESSGKYCEGRDTTAGSETADTAEAGTFQASYNSHSASPDALNALWVWFKANPQACDLSVWKAGVDPSVRECAPATVGTGPGASWQEFVKACPAFGAEWAMVLTRVLRAHFGPLNRKEAEFLPACDDALMSVQARIMADPVQACAGLL